MIVQELTEPIKTQQLKYLEFLIDNNEHPNIITPMGSMADIDRETANATRAFIKAVASRYDVAGAILFGSRARMTDRPDSDADVAILLHGGPGKFVATKLALADLAYDILLETGIRIQPLPIWEDEWAHPETYSNPHLLHNIEREGIHFLKAQDLMAKAIQAAVSAKLLLDAGDADGACNRAYYAMFDAARAALLASGAAVQPEIAKTHNGLISAFSLHLVRTARVSVDLGKALNKAEELRLIADYRGDRIDKEDVVWAVSQVQTFVDAMQIRFMPKEPKKGSSGSSRTESF